MTYYPTEQEEYWWATDDLRAENARLKTQLQVAERQIERYAMEAVDLTRRLMEAEGRAQKKRGASPRRTPSPYDASTRLSGCRCYDCQHR